MALAASNIPIDAEQSEYIDLLLFIQMQYQDLTGQAFKTEDIIQAIKYIVLPKARALPVSEIEEYYRLTVRQLHQSA